MMPLQYVLLEAWFREVMKETVSGNCIHIIQSCINKSHCSRMLPGLGVPFREHQRCSYWQVRGVVPIFFGPDYGSDRSKKTALSQVVETAIRVLAVDDLFAEIKTMFRCLFLRAKFVDRKETLYRCSVGPDSRNMYSHLPVHRSCHLVRYCLYMITLIKNLSHSSPLLSRSLFVSLHRCAAGMACPQSPRLLKQVSAYYGFFYFL